MKDSIRTVRKELSCKDYRVCFRNRNLQSLIDFLIVPHVEEEWIMYELYCKDKATTISFCANPNF